MVKMPTVKNDADADSEMSENDHSVTSSRRDSSAEEADEPDSDDSSEMSESECERRRSDCIENLGMCAMFTFSSAHPANLKILFIIAANLEKQFIVLREQLYVERMGQVETQLTEVRGGRSQEYLAPLQALHDTMNSRKEVAEILKKYRLENIRHKFECEDQGARQHFEVSALNFNLANVSNRTFIRFQSEKKLAMDNLNDELLEKIRRLEEDSHNVDISWADWGTSVRTNEVRGPGRKKAVTVTGPYIVYMLKEEDIIDDWTVIRKAIKRTASAAS